MYLKLERPRSHFFLKASVSRSVFSIASFTMDAFTREQTPLAIIYDKCSNKSNLLIEKTAVEYGGDILSV